MLLIFFLVASNQVLLKFNTPILLISKVQCLPSIIWRHLIIFIKNEFLLVGVLICKNSETFMYKSSIAEGAAYLAHLIPIKSNNLLIVLITKYFVIFYVYRLFSKFFIIYSSEYSLSDLKDFIYQNNKSDNNKDMIILLMIIKIMIVIKSYS